MNDYGCIYEAAVFCCNWCYFNSKRIKTKCVSSSNGKKLLLLLSFSLWMYFCEWMSSHNNCYLIHFVRCLLFSFMKLFSLANLLARLFVYLFVFECFSFFCRRIVTESSLKCTTQNKIKRNKIDSKYRQKQ